MSLPVVVVPRRRLDAIARRQLEREYPRTTQQKDAQLYAQLGLAGSLPAELARQSRGRRAVYELASRRLYVRTDVSRRDALQEAVRAVVHRTFGLRRADDRDGMEAAEAALAGTAALVAGAPAQRPSGGPPLRRFLSHERSLGVAAGRRLATGLRFYGGARAMRTLLTRPPISTAQLFHLDLYLERRAPQGLDRLPDAAAGATLTAARTFGELDVRTLLATFGVDSAAAASAGWSAGLSGLYRLPDGSATAVLALSWQGDGRATESFAAQQAYVASAFPGATAAACRQTTCWIARERGLALVLRRDLTLLVNGPSVPAAGAVADALVKLM
jgi:hypothetical protein